MWRVDSWKTGTQPHEAVRVTVMLDHEPNYTELAAHRAAAGSRFRVAYQAWASHEGQRVTEVPDEA